MKTEIKNYLIIFFVVIEILSMVFNFYFVKIPIGSYEYNFNFSIVFFCLGFFIVDIVSDQFSPAEAKKFIYYKFFSQSLFLALGNIAIRVYSLQETQLASVMDKSLWMLFASGISSIFAIPLMSYLMNYMKMKTYQGTSVFKRYICSTIPGELLFSVIFTSLCFSMYSSLSEVLDIFLMSALAKIILSICFAALMSLMVSLTFWNRHLKKHLIQVESSQIL